MMPDTYLGTNPDFKVTQVYLNVVNPQATIGTVFADAFVAKIPTRHKLLILVIA